MGCNYYFYTGKTHKETCPECGHTHRCKDKVHIGKSSFGRYFTLHSAEFNGTVLDDLESWMKFMKSFPKGYIKDEYGDDVTIEDMKKTITREDYKEAEGWLDKVGKSAGYNDVFGEKGLVHSNYTTPGKDGLYVVLSGDFC